MMPTGIGAIGNLTGSTLNSDRFGDNRKNPTGQREIHSHFFGGCGDSDARMKKATGRKSPVLLLSGEDNVQTTPEFIAYAKANPGKINMASAGTGPCNISAAKCSVVVRGCSFG
jgi:hypothetical protein